jgi:hypothetical protein
MTEQEALKSYAEKAAPVCGVPTWTDSTDIPWRMYADGVYAEMVDGDESMMMIPHIALCLWREHCREWLMARTIYLEPRTRPEGTWSVEQLSNRLSLSDGGWKQGIYRAFEDYDSALIAAVQAIEKEKSK